MMKYIGKTSVFKIFNSRTAVLVLVVLVLSLRYNKPFLAFITEKNHPISWCIFPFMLASYNFLIIYYFCIVYVHSDVPFMQHANMYQVIRTGRMRWAVGQIGGIFLRSLTVSVMTACITAMPFTGKLEWKNEWGKVIYTLANESVSRGLISYNELDYLFIYGILDKFTPIQLMGVTLGLCVLLCTFIGLMMFLISLFAERVFAVSGGLAFAVMFFFVQNAPYKMRRPIAHFVPACWAQVALMETPTSGYYRLPPLAYMYAVLLAGIAVMSAVICIRVRHVEFNWENED